VNIYRTGTCGVYVGRWRDDKRVDARATFHFGSHNVDEEGTSLEGASYCGAFVASRQDGAGVFTAADGSRERRVYKAGALIESEPQ
jgi:hypothetical protein